MTTHTLRQPEGPWSYEQLLAHVLNNGERRGDRTGTGTLSLFAPPPLTFDLTDMKVPLITSKKVAWKMALREFMWMLTGSTNINHLQQWSPVMSGIWAAWANKDGDIGPTYGAQYRNAGGTLIIDHNYDEFQTGRPAPNSGVDQVQKLIVDLLGTPNTRRALISLWSVPELQDMGIEPCMVLFQFSLRGERYDKLDLHVYQRSADMMLGVPFDLFQAGFLAHVVARELTLLSGRAVQANRMTWSAGDVHIYHNQIEAAREQLGQAYGAEPMRAKIAFDAFPGLRLIDSTLEPAHVTVTDYNPAPAIDAGKPAA